MLRFDAKAWQRQALDRTTNKSLWRRYFSHPAKLTEGNWNDRPRNDDCRDNETLRLDTHIEVWWMIYVYLGTCVSDFAESTHLNSVD